MAGVVLTKTGNQSELLLLFQLLAQLSIRLIRGERQRILESAFKDRLFAILSFSSKATEIGMWLLFI